MKTVPLLLTVLVPALIASPGRAEEASRITPPARVFASKDGRTGLKVLPYRSTWGGQGLLFGVGPGGEDVVGWRKRLLNLPERVWVCNYMRGTERTAVVTVGTFGKTVTENWLTVYGPAGEPVKSYDLEDLLEPDDLKRFKTAATSEPGGSGDGPEGAVYRLKLNRTERDGVTEDAPEFIADLPDYFHFSVNLLTGEVTGRRTDSDRPDARRISLEFANVPAERALKELFDLNPTVRYSLDPALPWDELRVTMRVHDMPFDAALNALLRSAGLRATRSRDGQGPVYTITKRTTPAQTAIP